MKASILLTLSLSFLLIGCAAERSRGFSLDDYKTDKVTEEKLQAMFPPGTDVGEFTKFMKELGIKCDVVRGPKTGKKYANCDTSTEFMLIQEIQWGISAHMDDQGKITKIKVGRYYNAL